MVPSKSQWRKWTVPSKASVAGLWISVLGLLLSFVYYLFPFSGSSEVAESVMVPGDSRLEQVLNRAKMEGVHYKYPSSAIVVAKPVVRPVLNELSNPLVMESPANIAMFTSVSPLKPLLQDMIFDPGQCRFIGKARDVNVSLMRASFEITAVSCVDSRAHAYELTAEMLDLRRLARVIPQADLAKEQLTIVWDDEALTLDAISNVIIMFEPPVARMALRGKAAERF